MVLASLASNQKPKSNYLEMQTTLLNIREKLGKLYAQKKPNVVLALRPIDQLQRELDQILEIYPEWKHRHFDVGICQGKIDETRSHVVPIGLSLEQCVDAFESAFKHYQYYTWLKCKLGDYND